MIRRSKVNGSKQGIILVMVLLIVAMAMIFISAALLLTSSTRNRLYNNAKAGQARLTVTAASEALYQAIQTQEIPDEAIEAFASRNAEMSLEVNDGSIPGLQSGSASNSYTTVKFSESTRTDWNEKTAKNETYNVIIMDFVTQIGGEKEAVQMILRKEKKDKKPSSFSTVIDLAGSSKQNLAQFNVGVGDGGSGQVDNIVIVRGTGTTFEVDRASGKSNSTYIFLGNTDPDDTKDRSINVRLRDDTYNGDLVFLGDNATLDWDKQPTINGNVMFYGYGSTAADSITFNGNSISFSNVSNSSKWAFVNRTLNANDPKDGNHKVRDALNGKTIYLYNKEMSWQSNLAKGITVNKPGDTSMNASIKKYLNTDSSDGKLVFLESEYPTAKDALGSIATADTSKITSVSATKFMEDNAYYDGKTPGFLTGGTYRLYDGSPTSGTTYKMNTTINIGNSDKSKIKFVFLNGADPKGYTIYLGSDYDMTGVVFVLLNPSKDNTCNFVLEKNVDLQIGRNNYSAGHYGTGFVSVSTEGCADPDAAMTFFDKNTPASYAPSVYNAGKKVPRIYIYGIGGDNGNSVTLGDSSGAGDVVEAFIGLYEDSYPGKSRVEFKNQVNYYYGRIMASSFYAGTDSNKNPVYYCPGPNAETTTTDPYPKTSQYSVYDVIYYVPTT